MAVLQVHMERLAVYAQEHNAPTGLESVLEYSQRAANLTLANWFGGFRVFRDARFAEGVILGAIREARYVALHHYKQMAAHPGWVPEVGCGFALLPRNHYTVEMRDGGVYLDAPLGASGSGIEPLLVRLKSPPTRRAYCGEVLVARDQVFIPYRCG